MADETKQTVADESAENKQAPADSGAQDDADIEKALSEFDQSVKTDGESKPSQPDQKPKAETVDPEVVNWVKEQQRKQLRSDLESAAKVVAGDTGEDLEVVEAWLDAQARKDPRLAEAWRQRSANPTAWKSVLNGLNKQWATKVSKRPDKAATEDREAVTAAVRSASNRTAEPDKQVDWGSLSEAELAREKEKYIR